MPKFRPLTRTVRSPIIAFIIGNQIRDSPRSISEIDAVHHEGQLLVYDAPDQLLHRGSRLLLLMRQQFNPNVVAFDDHHSERNGPGTQASRGPDSCVSAAQAELHRGERNDRGIPHANGFSHHAASFELQDHSVEIRQWLRQRLRQR